MADPDELKAFLAQTAPPEDGGDDLKSFLAQTAPVEGPEHRPLEVNGPSEREQSAYAHAKGLTWGLGKNIVGGATAALQAGANLLPAGFAKQHDISQAPAGDAYRNARDDYAREEAAAERADPLRFHIKESLGGLASAAAAPAFEAGEGSGLLVRGLARGGTPLAQGAVAGVGASDADVSRGDPAQIRRLARDVALSAGGNLLAGEAIRGAPRALRWGGAQAENAAGWLKTHSLHPTPTLGEAIEALPGGGVENGKLLLSRGIGGLTKAGTARQLERAMDKQGASITDLARAHDAGDRGALDLSGPLDASLQHAEELNHDPNTREAAGKLADAAGEYRNTYDGRVSASDALAFKRKLGKYAYGQNTAFAKSGDTVAGDYGAGLGKLERGVDSSLDAALGPAFENANLDYRRLMASAEAAHRGAARTQSNHLGGGLLPAIAGTAGFQAHGLEGAGKAGLAALLFDKYASQAGARALYSPVAGTLNGLGAATDGLSRQRALIQALRAKSGTTIEDDTQ